MIIKNLLKFVLFVLILLLFLSLFLKGFDRLGHYMLKRHTNATVAAIEHGFTGVIKHKYLDAFASVHLQLVTLNNDYVYVAATDRLAFDTQVGDTIVKQKNDNYVLVKRQIGDSLWVLYTPIPSDVRQHELFPEAWREKWME